MVETMKKRIIMILAVACILVVSGCGAASVSQEAKTAEIATDMQTTADIQQGLKLTTTEMDGMELRSVLDSNPSSIALYGFDEKEYEISDEKDIETIIENIKIIAIHISRPIILYGVLCAPQTNPSNEPF